jgi:tRNA modification GTPase
MLDDCIAAISTPPGVGALSIVRLSGAGCLDLVGRLFCGERKPNDVERRGVLVGAIRSADSDGAIDEVVLTVFREPGSYTGQDMVEICCHGGKYVPTAILEACLRSGARAASPGEFTRRAFLNGKIDLIQAEAIAGMIAATTRRAHRMAVDQLEKRLSKELLSLRRELRDLTAILEYTIDFPEEHAVDPADMEGRVDVVRGRIEGLLHSWREGSISTDGAGVVIAGRPNVGKSSLFNMMAKRTRAIVTPHPGTTRDAIEQEISLSGLLVRLVDTAGLRETADDVERLGVEVSRQYLEGADLVLYVYDAREGATEEDERFLSGLKDKDVILVANKEDLLEGPPHTAGAEQEVVYVSARTGEGFEGLRERIVHVALGGTEREGPAITTLRQRRGLEVALAALDAARRGVLEGLGEEFLVEDIRASVRALSELVGEIPTEEILEEIFSRFCVGK